MKINCDVCNNAEASVFCTADEAALCDGCDHRVHHANKLASKHQRFSLLRPKQHPLCDICQERRAFTFCQQDRAILCKECDVSVHSANEHTIKHDRFLLIDVKLSASAIVRSSQTLSDSNSVPSSNVSHQPLIAKTAPSLASITVPPSSNNNKVSAIEASDSTTASSISEYLIETLPGWQVDDFLDSSYVPFGSSKSDEVLPRFGGDLEGDFGSFSTENIGIWVPQVPRPMMCSSQMVNGVIGESEKNTMKGSSRSRLKDDSNFTVPQISPQSNTKRARYLW